MSMLFGMYCTVGLLVRALAVGATDAVAGLDYCAAEGTALGGDNMAAGALLPPRREASDSYAVETLGVSLVQRLLARSSLLPTDSDEHGLEVLLDQNGTAADAPGVRDGVGLLAASSPAGADTAGLERAAPSSPNLTSELGLHERLSGASESMWARGLQRIRWPDAQWLLAVEQEASCFLPIGLVLSGLVGALAFVVFLFTRVNGDGDDQLPFPPKPSAYLCNALVVPDGSECTLAVPSLQQEVPEGRLDLDVCDQTGRPFLRVALECTSLSAEYITLKSLDGSTYATCRVSIGNTQGARLCGFIYRPGSELFARLTEPPDMVGIAPVCEIAGGTAEGAAAGTLGVAPGLPAFSLWSVKAGEWGMHFHGDVTDRQVRITDRKMKLVAAALPGDGSLDRLQDHYLLRIEPGGDTGLVLCSLFVIDRILATRSKEREA